MTKIKEEINKLSEQLRRERDELRVKLNLAKMEAGDEWKKLEEKLSDLDAKAKELGDATSEASREIGAAAKLLGKEIGDGFKKIAKRL